MSGIHDDILKYLPHREPFLFVDEVLNINKGSDIHAIKRLTGEEDYFRGHFPNNPVMPGVIIIEALAQASGISSGGSPGVGFVQIKVGGGDWQQATDLSSSGDWSSWSLKLKPHIESGNSTMYSRLVISDDQMSPVDARRVILIDGQTGSIEDISGEMTFGFYALMTTSFTIVTFLGWKIYMTRNKGMKDRQ